MSVELPRTALLPRLADRVFSIERIPALAELARTTLKEVGIESVIQRVGDGTLGWPEPV